MSITEWVDVAIGLVVVFVGASLFVTVINEFVAQARNLRGAQLAGALKTLLDDATVKARLEKIPALASFFGRDGEGAASYVDPNVLAQHLLGALELGAAPAHGAFAAAVAKLPKDSILKAQLEGVAVGAAADKLLPTLTAWLERSLTMLGDGYKRALQKQSLLIGLLLAAALNIDTVAVTRTLYQNKAARDALAEMGTRVAAQVSEDAFKRCLAASRQEREADPACAPLLDLLDVVRNRSEAVTGLPLGWGGTNGALWLAAPGQTAWLWLTRIVGWMLTGLAVSLGAPFWFDLLNHVVNLRHGMRKPVLPAEPVEGAQPAGKP